MDSNRIRRTFIDFFKDREHIYRPSASLIPNDPTLLLTNAGMVPFKPFFLGEDEPTYKRAVSIQKCARTIDIDIIGSTHRHLSFFEMMGNFSFGDYFKEQAIAWAHELVTSGYGLDPDRLWYTVHETDDDARAIWIDQIGIPSERVQKGGNDNFWQMGVPGPCGPCSELFYDKGPEYGDEGGPIGGGEERYVEIWNLVFMQNIQDEPYHVIGDLPAKNIDTGMGLERMAAILQSVDSVFETDAIRPVLDAASGATDVAYGSNPLSDVSLRILADHGRSMTMLIGDGVVPSNEGRGYVLRRLIRRAVRHAWQLKGRDLITPHLVEATIDTLAEAYPELTAKKDTLMSVVEREEAKFRKTLESGHQLLDTELEGRNTLPGPVAFKLHDTFGFPIELTTEIANERGVEVDRAGFDEEMDSQRSRARKAWRGGDTAVTGQLYGRVIEETGPTTFIGYEAESGSGRILAMIRDGEMIERAEHGQEVEIFFDVTPFYAESGGQVGDTGSITTESGVVAVFDTRHALQGLHGHRSKVASGFVQVGQTADLAIDSPRRETIRKSHTGTHVLHWALREVLGGHAHQAGSLVESGRLRFDFSHFAAVAPTEIAEIEALANHRLIENGHVTTTITTKEEAERQGALAFFGDKYGETVRLVKIGQFSAELCGGTHTHTAAQVGPLIVLGESSIGSNIRRIEALTGATAYRHITDWRATIDETAGVLRAAPAEIPERVRSLINRIDQMEAHLESYRHRDRTAAANELAGTAEQVGTAKVVVANVPDLNAEQLRLLALAARDRLGRGMVVLGSAVGGKGSLVAVASRDLVNEGISAADVVMAGAKLLGGGGSRDPELAQAGGPHGDQLDAALAAAHEAAATRLNVV